MLARYNPFNELFRDDFWNVGLRAFTKPCGVQPPMFGFPGHGRTERDEGIHVVATGSSNGQLLCRIHALCVALGAASQPSAGL